MRSGGRGEGVGGRGLPAFGTPWAAALAIVLGLAGGCSSGSGITGGEEPIDSTGTPGDVSAGPDGAAPEPGDLGDGGGGEPEPFPDAVADGSVDPKDAGAFDRIEDEGGAGDEGTEPEGDVEPECGEPAAFGCKCVENDDCLSGWCVPTEDGLRCTKECVASCPDGFTCKGVNNAAGDPAFVCVPLYTNLCRPCATGADCKQLGDTGGYCIPYLDASGFAAGSFCGGLCSDDQPCPDGYDCKDVKVPGGAVVAQCVLAQGECGCNPKAAKEAAATACFFQNEHGKCAAPRVCEDDGLLSECLAKTPLAETCNAKDDDCDGKTDEAVEESCFETNEHGTCHGEGLCVDGKWLECNAKLPAPDTCNGSDDDCDGLADEGFPDEDGDQLADCVDPDQDGDGIDNDDDLCPEIDDPGQEDQDGDGIGDACDPDEDGDGTENAKDCDPADPGYVCTTYYWDEDQDGAPKCKVQKCLCAPQGKYTATSCETATEDCADLDPAVAPGKPDVCNGKDDDCSGATDDDFPELGQSCDGADADQCALGEVVCAGGGLGVACDEAPGDGLVEACNGGDDDCDGETDEEWSELGAPCDGADGDLCTNGVMVCDATGLTSTCSAESPASVTESCNGQDDDCDGETDEAFPDLGLPCDGGDDDLCELGTVECAAGGLSTTCGDEVPADTFELCDGADNDCDGGVDEVYDDLGLPCDGPDSDSCELGIVECTADGAGTVCGAEIEQGVAEVCNGLDDDCSGGIDEPWPELGLACDGGDSDLCEHGVLECGAGGLSVVCGAETVSDVAEDCQTAGDDDCDGESNEGCKPATVDFTVVTGFGAGLGGSGGFGADLTIGETGVVGPAAGGGAFQVDFGFVPASGVPAGGP